MGFLGDSAMHLDVGELLENESIKDPSFARNEAVHVGDKMKKWILKHHKNYYNDLSKHIDSSIESMKSVQENSSVVQR
jgi:hypothetical protein